MCSLLWSDSSLLPYKKIKSNIGSHTRDDPKVLILCVLVALSRDIFERHTMHHSKELAFIFITMLIFSRCSVVFNNYSTLYMVHCIPLACFHLK